MENLFNSLNLGYITNTSVVKISLKKKYILILEKLLRLNCINGYSIEANFVFVKLRYFQNKPLFFFSMKSKNGNKIYKKKTSFHSNFCITNLSLFFTSKGLLTKEEAVFKNVGGEFLVDILFLDKK
jgi:ribosomal protein S8